MPATATSEAATRGQHACSVMPTRRPRECREGRTLGKGPDLCACAAPALQAPKPSPQQPHVPSLPHSPQAGPVVATRSLLGQVREPAICSLLEFKQPCSMCKVPTKAHTQGSHGNQANGGTWSSLSGYPSPGFPPRSPGKPPGPHGECKWEMRGKTGPSRQHFKPQRTISVAECKQNLPNAQNKCLRKSIFPAGCAN